MTTQNIKEEIKVLKQKYRDGQVARKFAESQLERKKITIAQKARINRIAHLESLLNQRFQWN